MATEPAGDLLGSDSDIHGYLVANVEKRSEKACEVAGTACSIANAHRQDTAPHAVEIAEGEVSQRIALCQHPTGQATRRFGARLCAVPNSRRVLRRGFTLVGTLRIASVSSAMRIRTLNILIAQNRIASKLAPERDSRGTLRDHIDGSTHQPRASFSHRRQCEGSNGLQKHLPPLNGWLTRMKFVFVMLIISLQCTLALSTFDFESITFREWKELFDSASASMQLPQVYLTAPRIRAKIFLATSMTMTDLLSGEAIFRQRISEIVDVAVERVFIEYIETTALHESGRGSWALSLGISAVVPPPTASSVSNDTLVMTTVDAERKRIVDLVMFGGIVRGLNVTIPSLQLFGSPMRLVSVHLDGEAFYQLDTTPWVGARLVVATQASRNSTSTTSAVTMGVSSSSARAIQNLRVRFLVAHYLQRLRVDTSSIIVRDPIERQASNIYGVPAFVLQIEIHVGDNSSLRYAVDGYMRNATLAAALRELVPEWALLTVAIDGHADELQGNVPVSDIIPATSTTNDLSIQIQIDALPLAYVQHRGFAMLDAIKAILSRTMNSYSVLLSVKKIAMASISASTADTTALRPFTESKPYLVSGANDMQATPPPSDRPFIVYIQVTPRLATTLLSTGQVDSALIPALASTDARVALGLFDSSDLSSALFTRARVRYLQTTTVTSAEGPAPAFATSSSFVRVALTLKASVNATSSVLDAFELYKVRCALLLVLERVLVSNQELVLSSIDPLGTSVARIIFVVQLVEESQRRAIQQAVFSWRLTHGLAESSSFVLVDRSVDLHADGSKADDSDQRDLTRDLVRDSTLWTSGESTQLYNFSDPLNGRNPSVNRFAATDCPSPQSFSTIQSRYYGCLLLHWSSEPRGGAVFLQTISAPSEIVVNSTNIQLPSVAADPMGVPAPWITTVTSGEKPIDWIFQFFSTVTSNATVNFTLGLADGFGGFYPALVLSMELQLADTYSPQSRLQVVSLRRFPVSLVPYTYASVPWMIVAQMSRIFVGGTLADPSSDFNANISISMTFQSVLGLADSTSAMDRWPPTCLPCLNLLRSCWEQDECTAITSCFQQRANQRLFLASELLQKTNSSFDLSDELRSCLTSSSMTPWSSSGRSMFLSGIQCLSQASCNLTSVPSLNRTLLFRYTPREHVIRLNSAHFPLSLTFLLDINGGIGSSPDGASWTRTSDIFADVTPSVLAALRALVLDLFGDLRRGLDVNVSSSSSSNSSSLEIRLQYSFMDAGKVSLPFVSVVTNHTAEPPPIVETMNSESLKLVAA